MALHFTYSEEPFGADLCQGDVLARTEELDGLLSEYYPQYWSNRNNRYFIVLTQTCDLVRRDAGFCSARYIALAPARPISLVIGRKLEEEKRRDISGEAPICTDRSREKIRLWLERLLNNNEANYFFLHRAPERKLADDTCAFLALSIAIKSDLHYEKCLNARLVALASGFQAKLGWLVGQMYSRVGTQDWPTEKLKEQIQASLQGAAIWVSDRKLKALTQLVAQWRADHPEEALDQQMVDQLLTKVPKQKDQVIDRILQVLSQKGLVENDMQVKARNLITNDPALATLLKE